MKNTLRNLALAGTLGLAATGCTKEEVFYGNVNGNEVEIHQYKEGFTKNARTIRRILIHYGKHNWDNDIYMVASDLYGNGDFENINLMSGKFKEENLAEGQKNLLYPYTNQDLLNSIYEEVLKQNRRDK